MILMLLGLSVCSVSCVAGPVLAGVYTAISAYTQVSVAIGVPCFEVPLASQRERGFVGSGAVRPLCGDVALLLVL